MKSIIKVEGLSKQYRIGTTNTYSTLRDAVSGAVRAPLKRLLRNGNNESNTIWALKDVSFEIQPGEVVGIIGRNGVVRSHRKPAGGRNRFSPGADWTRKHVFEWRDSRDAALGD